MEESIRNGLGDFKQLVDKYDPNGKFWNDFLNKNFYSSILELPNQVMGTHYPGLYCVYSEVMMNSIVDVVFNHAQQQPERPAIFFEDQVISYGQLYADVERFAHALAAWGIQSGDCIALFLGNCPAFIVSYLGIQLAGGVVVLVNTQYRQVELRHIMTDADVRLCITSIAGRKELQHLMVPTLTTLVIVDDMDDP